MPVEAEVLATGPWSPGQVSSSWSDVPWQPPPELDERADAAIAELTARGSPSHDGLAARLAGWSSAPGSLSLELEPTRWALRLVEGTDSRSLTAMCVVRTADGRWLAGRRASWLASWPGRWALGAAGAVEVGEEPAVTLTRELDEEWRLEPEQFAVSALMQLPSGIVSLVGLARVADSAEPVADAEHDEFAWWPADVAEWPAEADERLRRLATFVTAIEAAR